ncbi:MAG: hypothetical protein AAFR61_03545 [Bacteroidota bacterium]
MKINRIFALLSMSALSLLAGCKMVDLPLIYTHTYAETQCSDPWTFTQDATHEESIEAYLEGEGVAVEMIAIEGTSGGIVTCAACTCPSGRTISVQVPDNDHDKIEALGWAKIE